MPDQRSEFQKRIDATIGPPLYYCDECKLAVKVVAGAEPQRPCGQSCSAPIIAQRKAIVAGAGGMSLGNRVKSKTAQIAAALTGRCV